MLNRSRELNFPQQRLEAHNAIQREESLKEAFFLGQRLDERNDEKIMKRVVTIAQIYNAGPAINAMVTGKKK